MNLREALPALCFLICYVILFFPPKYTECLNVV